MKALENLLGCDLLLWSEVAQISHQAYKTYTSGLEFQLV